MKSKRPAHAASPYTRACTAAPLATPSTAAWALGPHGLCMSLHRVGLNISQPNLGAARQQALGQTETNARCRAGGGGGGDGDGDRSLPMLLHTHLEPLPWQPRDRHAPSLHQDSPGMKRCSPGAGRRCASARRCYLRRVDEPATNPFSPRTRRALGLAYAALVLAIGLLPRGEARRG